MPSETSSAAVPYTPRLGAPAAVGRSLGERARVAPAPGAIAGAAVSPNRRLRRLIAALAGFAEIVAVGWGFALAIVAICIPVALLVRLAIWVVRALSGW